MNPTDNVVNKATEGLDDDLQPLEGETNDTSADTKAEDQNKDTSDTETKTTDDAGDDAAEDTGESGAASDDAGGSDDDGYTIDETDEPAGTDDAEAPEPPKPQGRLNPEQQYIYDNLPDIVTYGHTGDGQDKEYRVKVDSELPKDFEFASKADERAFYRSLSAQELNARQLQTTYQNEQSQQQARQFQQQEDAADRSDIATMQKEGELPRFKVKVDDPGFDKDPAAKLITDILQFKEQRNQQYLEEYQRGRPFRHIGFQEAYYMFRRQNPERTRSTAQQKEDAERKDVARKVGPSKGVSPSSLNKPRVQPGMSTRDVMARIEALDW